MASKRPIIIGLPASLLPPAIRNMRASPIWTTQRAIVSARPGRFSVDATGVGAVAFMTG
jgi:hypothetical protein